MTLASQQQVFMCILILFVGLFLIVGISGCKKIEPIIDWFVGFATATGDWVIEKAATFAQAVQSAWQAFWGTDLINNVKPDPNNPLEGEYDGTLKCEVGWGKVDENGMPTNKLSITLECPHMVRQSEESTQWELAPSERQRIEVLQQQLLSAG